LSELWRWIELNWMMCCVGVSFELCEVEREEKYHVKFKVGGESVFVWRHGRLLSPRLPRANHMQAYNVRQKCGSVNVLTRRRSFSEGPLQG
jgi:hypothetical protein